MYQSDRYLDSQICRQDRNPTLPAIDAPSFVYFCQTDKHAAGSFGADGRVRC